MSALLKLLKISPTTLKPSLIAFPHRAISTTPTLLFLNKKLTGYGSSRYSQEKYIEKDRVPASSKLIYKAPMETYIRLSMYVSTISASLVTSAALYQYACNRPILDSMYGDLVMHSEDIYYFAAGFVLINAALRFVVSMIPQRIYKDNGKYLAVFHSQLPGGLSHHKFNQGEVKEVEYTFSPWNKATYKLGTKATLIFEDNFKTPSEFYEMCRKKD